MMSVPFETTIFLIIVYKDNSITVKIYHKKLMSAIEYKYSNTTNTGSEVKCNNTAPNLEYLWPI